MKNFNETEFSLIKKIMTMVVCDTKAFEMFCYDEAETTQENNRQYDYYFKQGVEELIEKPSSMTQYDWEKFLEKLL